MLTIGILSFGTSVKAQEGVAAIQHSRCTNATLDGDYGAQVTGYRPNYPRASAVPNSPKPDFCKIFTTSF